MSDITIHTVKLVYEIQEEGKAATIKEECVLIAAPDFAVPQASVEGIYRLAEKILIDKLVRRTN